MIHNAKDLSPDQKLVLESLLGRPVLEEEAVSVRVFEQPALSDQRRQEIMDELERLFAKVDADRGREAHDDDEVIAEAMRSTRPNYRTRPGYRCPRSGCSEFRRACSRCSAADSPQATHLDSLERDVARVGASVALPAAHGAPSAHRGPDLPVPGFASGSTIACADPRRERHHRDANCDIGRGWTPLHPGSRFL